MRIVFMGTPDFAVPSLQALAESPYEIVAVVTGVDKPAGRGLKLQPSPVKECAQKHDLTVLQPMELTQPGFIAELEQLAADLFVVVAFRILPSEVFRLPPMGTINVHASLLPKYRGAAPINWAIINGESETGITTFFIEEKVDTGEWILQRSVKIDENETAGELHDKLARVGAEVLVETAASLERGEAVPHKQSGEATRAPKLSKELTNIRWGQDSLAIHNLIRGLSPRPGAFTTRHGKVLKIFRTKTIEADQGKAEPGEIVAVEKTKGTLDVATGSGVLRVIELQPQGKRRMSASEYLRGNILRTREKLG